jgi:hypothetical protein
MSHISQCSLKIELKDAKTLKTAMLLMEKEGYKVQTTEKGYKIDLRSKGISHRYGGEYNYITIEKEKTGDKYTVKGDSWSIQEGFNRTIKDIEKSYTVAGLNEALKSQGFMTPSVQISEKSTSKSMGKVLIKAVKF